ncbi:hypothetical protein [Hymenobacter negativus]|uniref:T9SS type A sorting domain-containing protein n=1 Tax=Hymenobacter negativus TaxID=2795026 RepID=A0ABS3QPU0_9BACT|nr:hypothetical protein [Hymenobacter negativus]MBO2012700.1 hypothetical protein [Hymenobacter negativus]
MMTLFLRALFFLLLVAFHPAVAQLAPPTWGPAQAITSVDNLGVVGQVIDAQGNMYIAGAFQTTVTLAAGTVLTSRGTSDGFVAKYSAAGTLVWVVQAGGPSYDRPAGLAIDATGTLHLVGNFANSVQVGTQTVSFAGTSPHFYVATITPQGQVSTLRQDGQPIVATNTGTDASASGIALDAAGNEYVTGYLSGGPVAIGGTSLTGSTAAATRLEYFVVKYNAGTATALWARQGGRVPSVAGQTFYTPALVVSPAGEAYLIATFPTGTGAFGALPLPTEQGSFDVGVVKYNAQGTEQWVRRSGGAGADQARYATLDGSGRLAVASSFSGAASFGGQVLTGTGTRSGALLVFDALSGAELWGRALTGTTTAFYGDAVTDAAGNFYLVGTFDGTGAAGAGALTSAGGTDAVVVSYSPQGAFRWQQQSTGSADEMAFSIRLDNAQRLRVVGSFIGTAQLGSTALTGQSTTNVNVLVAQLAALPLAARVPQAAQPLGLSPNPAHGETLLPLLPIGTQLTLTDALGRVVRPNVTAAPVLSLLVLAPGLYHVLATAPDGRRWASRLQVE